MSAPLLSPVDTPIYDDLIIEQLNDRFEDEVSCVDCEMTAEWRLTMRCCGDSAMLCGSHRDSVRQWSAAGELKPHRKVCTHCKHRFPVGATFDDAVREVRL